jgi:hypothetical protein
MNLINPDPKDVMAAISGPRTQRAGLLNRIAAPLVNRVRASRLDDLMVESLRNIDAQQFKPLGRLKHLFFEPDDVPVENLERYKAETGHKCAMIFFPQEPVDREHSPMMRTSPPLGVSLDERHIYITSRMGALPAIVDPRWKAPHAVPVGTGGATPATHEDGSFIQGPVVQQRAELIRCGTITVGRGWRYHVISPVTLISIYGVDRSLYSISFEADAQGRKTTLLLPILEEMPGRPCNANAFLVFGRWSASTNERRELRFADTIGYSQMGRN